MLSLVICYGRQSNVSSTKWAEYQVMRGRQRRCQCRCCVGDLRQWGHRRDRLLSMIESRNPPCYLTCWTAEIKTTVVLRITGTQEKQNVCVVQVRRLCDGLIGRTSYSAFNPPYQQRDAHVTAHKCLFLMTFCRVQTVIHCCGFPWGLITTGNHSHLLFFLFVFVDLS